MIQSWERVQFRTSARLSVTTAGNTLMGTTHHNYGACWSARGIAST